MDWIQILAAAATIVGSIITIVGANFTFMKFLLKDTHRQVEILEEEHKEFKEEMKNVHKRFDQVNNRLDGLYRVILDRTYGKNIPDELK